MVYILATVMYPICCSYNTVYAMCLQCQSPFVGDGVSCTLDSDSDGYPDQALDSPTCTENPSLAYCTAVRYSDCVYVC